MGVRESLSNAATDGSRNCVSSKVARSATPERCVHNQTLALSRCAPPPSDALRWSRRQLIRTKSPERRISPQSGAGPAEQQTVPGALAYRCNHPHAFGVYRKRNRAARLKAAGHNDPGMHRSSDKRAFLGGGAPGSHSIAPRQPMGSSVLSLVGAGSYSHYLLPWPRLSRSPVLPLPPPTLPEPYAATWQDRTERARLLV